MVEVWLPYGKTEVSVSVPTKNLLAIIEPKERAGAEDPQTEIENALANPIGAKPLTETAKLGDKVSIALKDSGASTNQLMISAILRDLNSAGIKDDDVTVILGHDPFRPFSPQEKAPIFGEALSSRIAAVSHDCAASENVHVGRTSRGTEIYLNRTFTEADVKMLAGAVEPHPCAGYSGGREALSLGISSLETVQRTLSLSLDRKAERGVLDGNPVHEDMLEAAQLAEVDLTLNIVRNSRFEVVKAFAGDINAAFYEGVNLLQEMYKVPVEGRADIVFMSPGGSPFDGNLFEACKGIDGALKAAKKGKVIVLVAECLDGAGDAEFYKALSRFKDPRALEKSLKKRFTVGGLIAYRLLTTLQSARVILVSVMPDYYVSEAFGMKPARTANEAFRYASDVVGKNGKASFIQYGSLTMPLVRGAE